MIPSDVGNNIQCWVCQVGILSTIQMTKGGGSDFGIKSISLLLGDRNMLSPRLSFKWVRYRPIPE